MNPANGAEYRSLINEMSLPAWALVLLYKHRWDIEKVFDELKSKLEEQGFMCRLERSQEVSRQLPLPHPQAYASLGRPPSSTASS